MRRPPRNPKEHIFSRGLGWEVVWIGTLIGAVSLMLGWWAHNYGHGASWQTMIFTGLTMAQMGNALATRSQSQTLWEAGFLTNKSLIGAVLLTLVLQLAVVYVPFLQKAFSTVPLSGLELAVSLGTGVFVLVVIDSVKLLKRKFAKG